MNPVVAALKNTVSISNFNRGLAGKIFSDVKKTGPKIVIKNNIPECVLLSPEEYIRLIDELNEAKLLAMAKERMSGYDEKTLISQEKLDEKYGFKADDIKDYDEVELE